MVKYSEGDLSFVKAL